MELEEEGIRHRRAHTSFARKFHRGVSSLFVHQNTVVITNVVLYLNMNPHLHRDDT